MLDELSGYENLGTPAYFAELFSFLIGSDSDSKTEDIAARFFNRVIDNRHIFDGCLPLLKWAEAVHINDSGTVGINPELLPALVSDNYLQNKLLEMILIAAKKDDLFHEIFCSNYISYDIIYQLIQIDVSAFRFRYANFRQLLLNFNFLYNHPDTNIKKYIVNSKYRKLFDRELMPEIKKRKLGIDELQAQLEKNRIHGEQAEIFVRAYERKRLASHPFVGNVDRISVYANNAGYDVVSYKDLQSKELDRFIEVKSFSGVPSFFWSRNELDVSRIKKNSYFLYLVDRDQMNAHDYVPMMVQNPHEEIINNEAWTKRIESYFIKKT